MRVIELEDFRVVDRRGEALGGRSQEPSPLVDEWPLIGREREVRQLRRLLAGDHRGVVLVGPAGAGKTRLALECLRWAHENGLATAQVTATRSARGLPFGALAPLLPALQGDSDRLDSHADLLRRSAAALVERGEGRRLVLLVDDINLLDDASATLIHQLATTDGAAFVLATARTREPAPDPVVALWKDRLLERVELTGLNAEAIESLLGEVLGGRVDKATILRLAVHCTGNVLFLRELVLGALADGSLANEGGIWRMVGPFSPSNRLVELVEARLEGLDVAERDLLEIVAVAESLGPAELKAMSAPELVNTLERKGLLTSRMERRRLDVRLVHPVYGDVLAASIPVMRTQEIARGLAEAVEATGARRREDTLRVAGWRLIGGGSSRPDLMLAAATTARWRYDFPLAERLARAALDAGAGFDAAHLAAQLVALQGRSAQAEQELAALAARATDDAQRGLVTVTRLDNNVFWLGRLDEGLRMAEEAEASIADPSWRDEIAARRAAILSGLQGPRAGAAVAKPLLERAEGRALVWAAIFGSHTLNRLGRLQDALEATRRGHDAHLALDRPIDWDPCIHVVFRCDALAHGGRFEEAETLASQHYEQALIEGSTEAQAFFGWQLGKTVGERGHIPRATEHLRVSVALFRQLDRPQLVQFALTHLVLALALGGRHAEAAQTLATLDALGLHRNMYYTVDLVQARAWTAAAAGDLPTAHRFLQDAVNLSDDIGDLVGQSVALHGLGRLGWPKEAEPGLSALVADVEGDLIAARAAHVSGLARRDPKSLEEVSRRFEAMHASLLAAEAAADAGVAWRRAGRRREAAAAETRAVSLLPRCEGSATPSLQAMEGRATLTGAQREVALLAAAGHSNKEIARKLGISVRTVENQLQHTYSKLGIGGRKDIAAALQIAAGVPDRP